jgi:hypothetical protein
VAKVTSVTVELRAVKGPRELGGALGLSFGAIGGLWCALSGEVRRDAARRASSEAGTTTTALHGNQRIRGVGKMET